MERLKMQFGKDEPEMMQRLLSLDWDENLWRYEKDEEVGGVKDSEKRKDYIRCYKKMQSIDQTLAITQMSISISKVLKCIDGEFPDGSFIVFKPDDSTNKIIKEVHSGMEAKGWSAASPALKLTNENYYSIEMKLNYSSGTVTLFIPRILMVKDLRSFLLIRLFIVLMSILTLFFIVVVASYLITKRLTKLIDRINENFENTNMWSAMDRQSQEDDLGKLEDKFYDMLEKVRDSYKRTMEYENDKKTFELELLQSRINPHFLYNTLSTMRWNCKSEKMARIIDSMVLYYRLALNKGDMIVKISHEMKLIEEYLKIQKYTYESDFTYIFEADENVKDLLTIRHLLQPIVENAVLHGINGLESGGVIRISVKSTGEAITLSVSDNGVGMSEETVNQLLYGEYKGKIGGYGIKNVQKRLNLFYGPNTSLQITSSRDKGTTTLITIPSSYFKQ
jgi:sensor histidine kinase YesM